MSVKLLTEHHLEFLSLKGGCRGSSESTLVKKPHCWKSHALAHFEYFRPPKASEVTITNQPTYTITQTMDSLLIWRVNAQTQ